MDTNITITRRQLTNAGIIAAACAVAGADVGTLAFAAEASTSEQADATETDATTQLPAPNPDPEDIFGVDLGVNMTTIDQYLGLPDVVYRDARMVFDTADWASMDADPNLTTIIEGFSVVPYPYLATLEPIPVDNAYTGDTLFTLTWDNDTDLNIVEATPNYRESMTILEDLFPKDKDILIMCGGGGYAYMTKKLLVFLGWDADKIYNIGGGWYYKGDHAVTLIEYGDATDGSEDTYALWRANIPTIDFEMLHAVEE